MTGAPARAPARAAAAPPCVAVGAATARFDASRLMPGWDEHSWGYHGDDGGRFHGEGAATARDPPFGRGDVAGCGIDRGRGEVFFTRNGAFLGAAPLSADDLASPIYPTVGLDHADPVHVNFGSEPFAYDLASHEDRAALRAALDRQCPGLARLET